MSSTTRRSANATDTRWICTEPRRPAVAKPGATPSTIVLGARSLMTPVASVRSGCLAPDDLRGIDRLIELLGLGVEIDDRLDGGALDGEVLAVGGNDALDPAAAQFVGAGKI